MFTRSLLLSALTLGLAVVGLSGVMADGPVEGRAGRAELRFMEGMIDHHQMAIDMANDCLAKASTQSVVTTCQNIIAAQTAEITTMQEWLLSWYNVSYSPIPMATDMEMMGDVETGGTEHNHNMQDMPTDSAPGPVIATAEPTLPPVAPDASMPATDPAMMMGMFAGLNRLEGVAYEIAWVESMIDHHDDALHMAERLLVRAPEGTGHDDLRALAQTIITDQTAEIALLETTLTELGG
jgi:uncharacterized protein (DUF305 family)